MNDDRPAASAESRPAILLRQFACAALAGSLGPQHEGGELQKLLLARLSPGLDALNWASLLLAADPPPAAAEDLPVLLLAENLRFTPIELLTVALLIAVQDESAVARAVTGIQDPIEGSWPVVGLAAEAFRAVARPGEDPVHTLMAGAAARSGTITQLDGDRPAVERRLTLGTPLFLALRGRHGHWPGTSLGMGELPEVPLAVSARVEAARQARALVEGNRALVIRSASPAEGRAMACAVVDCLGRQPVFIDTDLIEGLSPWLILNRLVPVFTFELAPGERRRLPHLPYYEGPVLAQTGIDGAVEHAGIRPAEWRSQVPPQDERRRLWVTALGDEEMARSMAEAHRHGAGRIAELGRSVRHLMALDGAQRPAEPHIKSSIWSGEGAELATLAQPLTEQIPDGALILSPTLDEEMRTLLLRCRTRDRIVSDLGTSAACRYRPGVRALFIGQSGTGKTLAAGWLATRLGMPIYRVDLAAVTSKYIGETEKNLALLLARAENAEVVLLFDEADSMFGRRTEVNTSNDRFANAQTNYLLQRIESFDGLAILTSNSRARVDSAFTRRFDAIIEFPLPGPEERREIWRSHLGTKHAITPAGVSKLAAMVDLTGGHIRNVVFHAAVLAQSESRPIAYADVVAGLVVELRKIGQQLSPDVKIPA